MRIPWGLAFVVVLAACQDVMNPAEANDESKTRLMRSQGMNVEVKPHGGSSLLASTAAETSKQLSRIAIQTDQMVQSLAQNATGATKALLHALRLCAPCKNYKRFGQDNDGGYVMCMDGMEKGSDFLKGAYSYGICGEDSWGMAVADHFKIPLYEYDCTDSWKISKPQKIPQPCAGCAVTYYDECLLPEGRKPLPKFTTMGSHFASHHHEDAPSGSLFMKMDIEGAEWQFFEQEPVDNIGKFQQVVVEFHDLHYMPKHAQYLVAVRKLLDSGLRVMHLHGNNIAGAQVLRRKSFKPKPVIPKVLEVSFMKADACSQIPYKYLENGVDQVNAPVPPELSPRAFRDFV